MLNKTYETPPFRDLHPYLFGWGMVSLAILVMTAIIVVGIIILERNQTCLITLKNCLLYTSPSPRD